MKKLIFPFFLSCYLFSFSQGQIPPNAFNYSAIARNAAGQPIATTTIGVQISILKTSPIGVSQYSENHFVNTDEFGLFNLVIGAGALQSGSMATIDWSNDNYYLKVGMDVNGGDNFLIMGTTQLLSVPYALFAKSAGSISSGSNFSGDYSDLTNAPTNVSSFSNDVGYLTTDDDQQQLSVSNTGDTLYLQNGGFVIIPGISAANTPSSNDGIVSNPGTGVTFDGHNYSSIVLGNGQEWMSENLRTTVYANGDPILNVTDNIEWSNSNTGAWAHYNNDSQFENPFGKLYNSYAVLDARNVCPSGWHVPSDTTWSLLINYLDPNADGGNNVNIAGNKMKSTGTQYWIEPNDASTNESGFSAMPGGYRDNFLGLFFGLSSQCAWWSSSEEGIDYAWARDLFEDESINRYYTKKSDGLSIRCVKN